MSLHLRIYITEIVFLIVKEQGILFARKIKSGTKILACLSSCNFRSFVTEIRDGVKDGEFDVQIDSHSTICLKKEESEIKLIFPNLESTFPETSIIEFLRSLRDCISYSFLFNSDIYLVGQLKAFSRHLATTKQSVEQAIVCISDLEAGLTLELDRFLQQQQQRQLQPCAKIVDAANFIFFHSSLLRIVCSLDLILQNKT